MKNIWKDKTNFCDVDGAKLIFFSIKWLNIFCEISFCEISVIEFFESNDFDFTMICFVAIGLFEKLNFIRKNLLSNKKSKSDAISVFEITSEFVRTMNKLIFFTWCCNSLINLNKISKIFRKNQNSEFFWLRIVVFLKCWSKWLQTQLKKSKIQTVQLHYFVDLKQF